MSLLLQAATQHCRNDTDEILVLHRNKFRVARLMQFVRVSVFCDGWDGTAVLDGMTGLPRRTANREPRHG